MGLGFAGNNWLLRIFFGPRRAYLNQTSAPNPSSLRPSQTTSPFQIFCNYSWPANVTSNSILHTRLIQKGLIICSSSYHTISTISVFWKCTILVAFSSCTLQWVPPRGPQNRCQSWRGIALQCSCSSAHTRKPMPQNRCQSWPGIALQFGAPSHPLCLCPH